MKKKWACLLLLVVVLSGCNYPAYVGKFEAEPNCVLLDRIQIHPDKTADLKFRSIKESVNWDIKIYAGRDTVIEIRDYSFIYRNDSLIGNTVTTYDCICVRKSVREARDKAKTTH